MLLRVQEVASCNNTSDDSLVATVLAGQQPDNRPTEEEESKSKFVADIVSIGSKYAQDLLKT
jgi:hypothetical protein